MARYSSVPAAVSLTPRTLASSVLRSPAWNLSAMTSRSRAGSSASAARTAVRRHLGPGVIRGLGDVLGIDGERGHALAAAQLVQSGIARDTEQPRALLS